MRSAVDAGLEARTIDGVRSSTRYLLNTFKEKIEELRQAGPELHQLLRFGVDYKAACSTAKGFFGGDRIEYVAIDGTSSIDQQLDLLVFYVGAFGYSGTIRFGEEAIDIGDPKPVDQGSCAVSAAIPLSEEDAGAVFGQKTESGIEVDTERLPEAIMRLAEYFIAYKAVESDDSQKVVLLDRTLAGDVAHLVWSTREMVRGHLSILEGVRTPFGQVTGLDLDVARMSVYDPGLKIPVPRSQLLRYAALSCLSDGKEIELAPLLGMLGADERLLSKLQDDFKKLESEFHIFDRSDGMFRVTAGFKHCWERVLYATVQLAGHIFDAKSEHPLRYTKEEGEEYWITANDLDYLALILIYELTRRAWTRNLLPIGFVKDTGASELVRTVVPLLESSGLMRFDRRFPNFNSDKMLLQTNSVINALIMPTPWHTIDMDAAFRTMAPIKDPTLSPGEARVQGAYGNLIYPERMYVKNYIQLWSSKTDPTIRSHVFTFDRPAYASYDSWEELLLYNEDNGIEEKIRPILNLRKESEMTNLIVSILVQMAGEVVPEALGHNYPLFLADKKAKSILQQNREAYVGAVAVEMAKSDLDQQVLFSQRFRDYRNKVESKRRSG